MINYPLEFNIANSGFRPQFSLPPPKKPDQKWSGFFVVYCAAERTETKRAWFYR